MYIDSLACVRVKGGESECFRINSGARQGCIMPPWLFNVYTDVVMKEVKTGMDGEEGREILEEGREWRLPGLLYADDLVEDLRVMVGHFAELCRRRGLKVYADKCKVERRNWSVRFV